MCVCRGGAREREEVKKTSQKKPKDWTLIVLLQLAKPQHNGPVTQSKQISSPSLNNGSTIAAFLTCKQRPLRGLYPPA